MGRPSRRQTPGFFRLPGLGWLAISREQKPTGIRVVEKGFPVLFFTRSEPGQRWNGRKAGCGENRIEHPENAWLEAVQALPELLPQFMRGCVEKRKQKRSVAAKAGGVERMFREFDREWMFLVETGDHESVLKAAFPDGKRAETIAACMARRAADRTGTAFKGASEGRVKRAFVAAHHCVYPPFSGFHKDIRRKGSAGKKKMKKKFDARYTCLKQSSR